MSPVKAMSLIVLSFVVATAAFAAPETPRGSGFEQRYRRLVQWAQELHLNPDAGLPGVGAQAANGPLSEHIAYGRIEMALRRHLATSAPLPELKKYYADHPDRYRGPDDIVGTWAKYLTGAYGGPAGGASAPTSARQLLDQVNRLGRTLEEAAAELPTDRVGQWYCEHRPFTPDAGDRDNTDLWDLYRLARQCRATMLQGPFRLSTGTWIVFAVERFQAGAVLPFPHAEAAVRRDYAAQQISQRLSTP